MENEAESVFWKGISKYPIWRKYEVFHIYLDEISPDNLGSFNCMTDGNYKRLIKRFLEMNRSKDPDYVYVSIFGPLEHLLPDSHGFTSCLKTGLALIKIDRLDKSEKYFKRLIEIMKIDKTCSDTLSLKLFVHDLYNSSKMKNGPKEELEKNS